MFLKETERKEYIIKRRHLTVYGLLYVH